MRKKTKGRLKGHGYKKTMLPHFPKLRMSLPDRHFPGSFRNTVFLLFLAAVFLKSPCFGVEPEQFDGVDFTEMSFEELKNVEIVTASRKPEKLSDSAAAVYVITSDDIRRSGATSIPEALRLAPGVQAVRFDTNIWAVSIRGFENEFSNKLLVLIDGRSIYSATFSGVFWDIRDVILENVERIEVIRGPGGSLWGANAVNGIINIITKKTGSETGTRLSILAGSAESVGNATHEDALGDKGFYRIYGKYFMRDEIGGNYQLEPEERPSDNWRGGHAGFRIDLAPGQSDEVMLCGESFSGQHEKTIERGSFSYPFGYLEDRNPRAHGGFFQGRWSHEFSPVSDALFQFYGMHDSYDYESISGENDILNLEFQYHNAGIRNHDIVFGFECRYLSDDYENSFEIAFHPTELTHWLHSAFVQDKIEISPDLFCVFGSKIEYNRNTGTEIQPSARFLWTPGGGCTLWGAVSRAVRTPSRLDRDSNLQAVDSTPGPVFTEIKGGDVDSEELIAEELGIRFHPSERLWMDISGFYHRYDRLLSIRMDDLRYEENPQHLAVSYSFENKIKGGTWGAEAAADWRATNCWRIKASYAWWRTELELDNPDSLTSLYLRRRETYSRWQGMIQSGLDVTDDLEFDVRLRYVERMPEARVDLFRSHDEIGAYTALDIRLAWDYDDHLRFSLVGRNLLDPEHAEYPSFEVERDFYIKVDWRL